ncbi:hypothetical protein EV714DRAFT_221876, partial [Schizophyllum commune]
LTEVEEMLISLVKMHIQVRYTRGRQLQYKDHIVNFPQDISELADRLPRLPKDIPMIVIRRHGDDLSQHVDFLFRREKVWEALLYKIDHDPSYAHLPRPTLEELDWLPEMGSVVNQIPHVFQYGGDAAEPSGPTEAASSTTDYIDEQSAIVDGVLNLGVATDEVTAIRQGAADMLNPGGAPPPPYEHSIVSQLLAAHVC